MERIGIVRDDIFLSHNPGAFHPESPDRLKVLYRMIEEAEMSDRVQTLETRRAERDEITLVHTENHFERIASTAGLPQSYLDGDTQTSEHSFEAALCAAGAVLRSVDLLMSGEYKNPIFTLVRPPGHHAEPGRAMGFCLFNNIALGARYSIERYGLKRVMIVDWDLHHGNGTQNTFYDDPNVLYFSTHQYPYYPGTGGLRETGTGDGRGFTVNVPLSPGRGDGDYLRIFHEILKPIGEAYEPEMVLVSAGFDIHSSDPLGGMSVSPAGFAGLAAVVQDLAHRYAGDRLILTLEGGYHLGGLTDSVRSVIEQLSTTAMPDTEMRSGDTSTERVIEEVKEVHGKQWPLGG
jgi:acetoin utilization deacetylase AcuC-like enzyme